MEFVCSCFFKHEPNKTLQIKVTDFNEVSLSFHNLIIMLLYFFPEL
jgi:hypothetical protein